MEVPPGMLTEKEQPELDQVEMIYWGAFQELNSERPMGGMGGVGAIPWSSIDRYAERHGFLGEGYIRFFEIIRFLDNKWLEMIHKRQEKEKAKKASNKPARSARPARRH